MRESRARSVTRVERKDHVQCLMRWPMLRWPVGLASRHRSMCWPLAAAVRDTTGLSGAVARDLCAVPFIRGVLHLFLHVQ